MSGSIHVVAKLVAAAGKREELEVVLLGMLAPTRAEDGCIRYDLLSDTKDEDVFLFVEEWRDGEALRAHGQSAHLAAAGAQMKGLLAERASVRYCTMVSPMVSPMVAP